MAIALVKKGGGGFGTPLKIQVTPGKDKIVCMTGTGINAVTKKIAEITGGKAVDGFRHPQKDGETACVVINCGGTLRLGIFPKKGIKTINVNPSGPSGPFAEYVKEGLYVSSVKVSTISEVSDSLDKETSDL